MDSKFIKRLGDLKQGDAFKFIYNGEVDNTLHTVFQIGRCESAVSSNRESAVYHHDAKVFHVLNPLHCF